MSLTGGKSAKLKGRYKKNYYMKVLFNYFIFTLVILILAFGLSAQLFLPRFEKTIKESNLSLLKYVQSHIDEKIEANTAQIISRHFVESSTLDLPNFFSPNVPLTSDVIIKSYQIINTIVQTHEYVDSVYLYRHFDDVLLSTAEGISYNALAESKKLSGDIPGLIDEISKQKVQPVWLSPETTRLFFENKTTISYATSIPLRISAAKSDGVIIINLNQQKLFESVQEVHTQKGVLLLLSDEMQLFSHAYSDSPISREDISLEIAPHIATEEEGYKTIKAEKESFGMVWLKSAKNNWKYVYLIPLSEMNKTAVDILGLIMLIFFIVFFLAMALLNFITFRLHKPLRRLVKTLSSTSEVENNSDDFTYMENVFSFLSTRVGEMEQTVQRNRTHLEYKAFIDLLYATPSQTDATRNSKDLFLQSFTEPNFQLVTLEIDQSVFARLETAQREFIVIEAKERVNSFLQEFGSSISICHPVNCVVSLLNFKDAGLAKKEAQLLLDNIISEMGAEFNMFISDPVRELSKTNILFETGKTALEYHYIYNYGNVFTTENAAAMDSFVSENSTEFFDEILELFAANQPNELLEKLQHEVAKIRRAGHSYQYVEDFCSQLSHRIAQAAKHLGVQIDAKDKALLTLKFGSIQSLDDYISWVHLLVIFHCEKISNKKASLHYDFIQRIAEYIGNNLEKDITLKSLAAHFHISPSHLSRILKEGLNTNFQEYLFDKKLERAAWYLKNEPSINVNKIASSLGYLTPAYFSKIFKKKYGVTPSQFRKQLQAYPAEKQNSSGEE